MLSSVSHLNKTIKPESIKLQPNDNFVVFDLTVFIYISILSRFLFYPNCIKSI